jgi:hypothetical protein
VVSVPSEGLGDDLLELGFDLVHTFAGRQPRAIADAENVGVDRERLLAEGSIEHDVGGLAADAGKRLQFLTRSRNLAMMVSDQRLAECDDVLRLGVEQADRLDRITQAFLAERNHLPGILDACEQGAAGDVDAGIGCLRGEDDRHQQLIGVAEFQLGCWRWIGFRQPSEELENLPPLHAPMTSRIE